MKIIFPLLLTTLCAPLMSAAATAGQDPALATAVRLSNGYKFIANQTYASASGTDLKLDVYTRPGYTGPQPVLIFIHGGGWVYGTKEMNALAALPYMQLGFAVVNIEYRLAETALAPAAVEDSMCALQWVGRYARQYNFDLSKVVVAGESAGGQLALSLGLMSADSPYRNQCAWKDKSSGPTPKVAAVINWFGISDINDLLAGPNLRTYAVSWFGSMTGRDDLARRLSPLTYVRSGATLPPVLTIHGDADPVVPYQQSVRLHQALDAAGVHNRLLTIPGGGHGNFNDEQDLQAFQAVREFLTSNNILR